LDLVVPAEWSPHRALWLGYPSHADLWADDLEPAREEVAALARALAGPGRERVRLLVHGEATEAEARRRLGVVEHVEVLRGRFGDIWLRDTGPIFAKRAGPGGARDVACAFRFNGWGGKYELPHDEEVAGQIADASDVGLETHEFVLEGGALDHDGQGTVITTRQCLLNPNRNPGWTETQAEQALAAALGARKVLWLDDGLENDHTDGHVDNLARFIGPGLVACPIAEGDDDPNAEVYEAAAERLASFSDARGAPLEVARIPSPGRIETPDGEVIPASHMNFLIANACVVLPVYEPKAGALAQEALERLFPGRKIIGLASTAILTGGGSFHCISQQEPA
jgi:agmatine deiminase